MKASKFAGPHLFKLQGLILKALYINLLILLYGLTNLLDFSENKSLPRHVGDLS
jgi:hypothetical protein